ncbi:MAG TPA: DUF5804 family protein [Methanocorpusculum sp.]|nr:DUF5804 family protein [Methanocorpusculum sp.]
MLVVCIEKTGIDLYRTLSDSETSRNILRFYHPKRTRWGITVEVSTVSNALSLLNELRWYIMRYMSQVLIHDSEHDIYLTRQLAEAVYENRSVVLDAAWQYAFKVCVSEDGLCTKVPEAVRESDDTIQIFHVWGLESQLP